MRKLFGEFGLAFVSVLVSLYVLDVINTIFIDDSSQLLTIIKGWISNLT